MKKGLNQLRFSPRERKEELGIRPIYLTSTRSKQKIDQHPMQLNFKGSTKKKIPRNRKNPQENQNKFKSNSQDKCASNDKIYNISPDRPIKKSIKKVKLPNGNNMSLGVIQLNNIVKKVTETNFQNPTSLKLKILDCIFKHRLIRDSDFDFLFRNLTAKFPQKEEAIKNILFQIVSSLDS